MDGILVAASVVAGNFPVQELTTVLANLGAFRCLIEQGVPQEDAAAIAPISFGDANFASFFFALSFFFCECGPTAPCGWVCAAVSDAALGNR